MRDWGKKFLGGKEKMGMYKKSHQKKFGKLSKKLELTAKSAKLYIQNVGDGIQKWVNLNTFCSNLTFKNRLTGWQAYRGDQGHRKNSPT